ncbi:MAG TPA: hypothetical protein VM597_20015 [Gemmataceae bacterium]|nr:hypothetical protein [Gemmataceae bacterium]
MTEADLLLRLFCPFPEELRIAGLTDAEVPTLEFAGPARGGRRA